MLATLLLAATGLAAGVTGTWSPCGFSMLGTLGPTGHTGGRGTTFAACAAFAAGALAGGAATFVALSYLGRAAISAAGGGSQPATAAAIVIALAAALGEARGVRVLPQVRRQVPEHWRRLMPLQLAGGLYGVLLGLGFTTFVLTLAVWALAGLCVALADPAAGLAIGLAFGAGRALPVVLLAPWIDTERGVRYAELMAQRPVILRSLRRLDGLLLALSALTLAVGADTAGALAAGLPARLAAGASDPSVSGALVAWTAAGGTGALAVDPRAAPVRLSGSGPALGGATLATHVGAEISVSVGGAPARLVTIPGTTQLAVSDHWLLVRSLDAGGRVLLFALPLPALAPMTLVAAEPRGVDLGRPSVDGDLAVVAINGRRSSRIVEFDLARPAAARVLRSARTTQLSNPVLRNDKLLFERATYCDQRLVFGSAANSAGELVLLRIGGVASRDPGYEAGHTHQGNGPSRCPTPRARRTRVTLWTTALGGDRAYVTELTPSAVGPPLASIFAVPLGRGRIKKQM